MKFTPLTVQDSYLVTPVVHKDPRGEFFETFRSDFFSENIGRGFNVRQVNGSVSVKGTLRGVHFAELPGGQAKFVQCVYGEIMDFIVDLRVGSPTFGETASVRLEATNHESVFLAEGLGHAFLALSDVAVVNYLVSNVYQPGREHGINPLDPALGLDLPITKSELSLSEKDRNAPSLASAAEQGMLPLYSSALSEYGIHQSAPNGSVDLQESSAELQGNK